MVSDRSNLEAVETFSVQINNDISEWGVLVQGVARTQAAAVTDKGFGKRLQEEEEREEEEEEEAE